MTVLVAGTAEDDVLPPSTATTEYEACGALFISPFTTAGTEMAGGSRINGKADTIEELHSNPRTTRERDREYEDFMIDVWLGLERLESG